MWDGGRPADGTTPPPLLSEPASSPYTVQRLRTSIRKAQSYLTEVQEVLDDSSPKLGSHLQRIFRGSLMQAELNAQREAELEGYLAAAKRRKQPKSRRQVQSLGDDGIVRVKDAMRRINARKAAEYRKVARRIEREEAEEAA